MIYNIIKTENYLIAVGEDRKRGWFYCVRRKSFFQDEGEDVLCCNGDLPIEAHLPLGKSPVIKGVDLLPAPGQELSEKILLQPKTPTRFKCEVNETQKPYDSSGWMEIIETPKTTINSQNQNVLVGKYIN